jgi:hypothetical protein
MPLTEREKAAQRLVADLHALGAETQPDEDNLRIRFPESPRRQVIQLLKDGGWEHRFVGMIPRLCLADGRMPLWHVFDINLSSTGDGNERETAEGTRPGSGVRTDGGVVSDSAAAQR